MDIEHNKENIKQTQLNWWFILMVCIFPPTILVVTRCKKAREIVKLTPDSLDKQNLFWIAIITPIIYFIIIGVIAWVGTDVHVNYQGFNKFLEISKLPLGILALSPILGVIVSNVHRTIQTEKQILVTERKNTSDSFYSHYKFITEEFKDISFSVKVVNDDINIENISVHYMYNKFFTGASPIKGIPDKADIISIEFLSTVILDDFIKEYLTSYKLDFSPEYLNDITKHLRENTYKETMNNIKSLIFDILDELNYETTLLKMEIEKVDKKSDLINCLFNLLISVNKVMNRMLGVVGINESDLNCKMIICFRIINEEFSKLRQEQMM